MDKTSEYNKEREVFIGARSLGDLINQENLEKQVNLILPTYDLLMEQVEQIRQVAESQRKENRENKIISKRENNNTIGIFGARGTGKTSVLYTIMEQLEERGDSNIILPIIEPDNFGENTKIIGSIVGLLSSIVDEELDYIKKNNKRKDDNDFFKNCIYKENNPLNSKRKELIEYYVYTESEYRKLLASNYEDIATHTKKTSHLLIPDIEFKKRLSNLIDSLIENRQKYYKEETPMIFLFIDDIDLKTTKCRELIDSILQYSNHPNVITFLSGDYDILKESVTLSLIADENLAHSNLTIKDEINPSENIWDRKLYLSNEYLKKIIPPARRHNLINWNIESIPKFTFGHTKLSDQLTSLMGEKNLFGYKSLNEENKEKDIAIKSSYSIFDKTPRGLINVYYHIHQINNSKNNNNEIDYFKNIKALIDTIIVSSRELIDEQKNFFEKCLLWGDTAESTFINYNEILKYNEEKDGIYKIHESFFNLFLICEVLKELVNEVNYEEIDYNKTKNMVLKTLYLDSKDKLKNREVSYLKGGTDKFKLTYLHQVVLAIAENVDFKTGLILLQDLISGNFKEDYAYSSKYYYNYYNEDEYEKNKNVFISIYNLIVKKDSDNENLLKILYLKNYNENYVPLNNTFSFLNNMCSTTSEYNINERTFKVLLDIIFKEDDSRKNESKSKEYYNNLTLKKMLLINTFIKIQGIDEKNIEYRVKESESASKDYKELKFVRELNNNINNDFNDEKQRNIKRIIGRLGVYIQGNILISDEDFELKLAVDENEILKKGIKEFLGFSLNNPSGTVYSDVKRRVKNIIDDDNLRNIDKKDNYIGNLEVYKKVLKEVTSLAINNKVWYGRREAIRFLAVLKQQFYLDLDIFHKKIPLIKELAKYLKQSDQIIKEYNEFEKIKIDMKKRLEKSSKDARIDMEDELEQIGSNLVEEEKENNRTKEND